MTNLFLPNLLKERTISPTFRNGLKIKKKMNINLEILQQIKMKLKDKKVKHEDKYKKMSISKKYIYNNKKMRGRDVSSKRNKNISANKSNLADGEDKKNMYATFKGKKLKHNFSALNI